MNMTTILILIAKIFLGLLMAAKCFALVDDGTNKYSQLKWQSSLNKASVDKFIDKLEMKRKEVENSITEEHKKIVNLTTEEKSKRRELRNMRLESIKKDNKEAGPNKEKIADLNSKLHNLITDLQQAQSNHTLLLAKSQHIQTALQEAERLRTSLDAFERLSAILSSDDLQEHYNVRIIPLKNMFFSALMAALYGSYIETRIAIEASGP